MIEKETLVKGAIYRVSALNFSVAIWTGETFRGPKQEYNTLKFFEEKGYWEPLPHGTCTPRERISETILAPPFDGVNLLKTMYALDGAYDHIEELERDNENTN